MRHILYLAHGADCFIQEAAYSILSLWRQVGVGAFPISVLTDRADVLQQCLGLSSADLLASQVQVFTPDASLLEVWRGPAPGYVHRIKPLGIAWMVEQLYAAGASTQTLFLFVDSDTVFTQDPTPLFEQVQAGDVVLNALEGDITSCRSWGSSQRRLYRACLRHTFHVAQQPHTIGVRTALWNSGVMGFDRRMLAWLNDSVALIDEMRQVVPINIIEQVALSVVLQKHQVRLRDSGAVILHYHNFKEFRTDLALYFERVHALPCEQRLQHWADIDPALRIQPKLAFLALPKWRRQWRKYMGKHWKPLPYPWQNS